jgi:hypothetical protein
MTTLKRPNGKTYRSRLEPEAVWCGEDSDIITVLRTHDLELAEALATALALRDSTDLSTFGKPSREWLREGYQSGELMLLPDAARGFPCVVYREEW